MQAASGCVPLHFSRSVWVFQDVLSLASPRHALQLNYNEVQWKWRSQANVRFLECAFLCKIKEQGLLHSWRMKRRLRHCFTVVSKGQNESWLLKKKHASHHHLGRGKKKLKMWIHSIISPLFYLQITYSSQRKYGLKEKKMRIWNRKKKACSPINGNYNTSFKSEMNFKYWLYSGRVGLSFKGIDLALGDSSLSTRCSATRHFGIISPSLSPVFGLWSLSTVCVCSVASYELQLNGQTGGGQLPVS